MYGTNINPQTVTHIARRRQMFAFGGFHIVYVRHKPQNVQVLKFE